MIEGLIIPDGWHIEPYASGYTGYYVLQTPGPPIYTCTLDFEKRGVRSGFSTTGNMLGERYDKKKGFVRPTYTGRGWKQKLVDAAVEHLKSII